MRFTLPAALLLVASVWTTPAVAHDRYLPNDEIVLQLSAEGWVQTASARVVAVVQKALTGEEAATTADRVPEVLSELAPNVEWHVLRSDRSRDSSGLERWRITAEARLPEGDLGGIYDRARNISKPGQQVEIAEVDFTPTLQEREQTAASLRGEIYEQALAEARRVATAFPDAGYRVTRVDFAFGAPPMPPQPYGRDMMARAAPMAMESADQKSGGQGVSERMVVNATITIGAPPPDRRRAGGGSERDPGERPDRNR